MTLSKQLIRQHLEYGLDECRWCFAVDFKRVKGKEAARFDFPDATLIHYSCPRCHGEFSAYINGWSEEYVKNAINTLHPELQGSISDEFIRTVNHRVLYDFNLGEYLE